MITLIAFLFFTVLYLLFFASALFQSRAVFTCIIILFIIFYDYVFINLSYYVNPSILYVLKLWQEYLFFFMIFIFLFKLIYKKTVAFNTFSKKFFFITLFLSIYGIIRGIGSASLIEVLLGWRMYIMPFLLIYLLYQTDTLKNVSLKLINYLIIGIGIFIVLVAFYKEMTFKGNLTELYFYEFMDRLNPLDTHTFDFIRDNRLRATGVFVSPLIYSGVLAYACLTCLFYLILSQKSRTLPFFLLLILMYGQYISRTRIGFIILIVGVITSLISYRRPSISIGKIFLVPLALVTVTFLMLVFGLSEDPSALGRLVQYAAIPENFNAAGVGLGNALTAVKFDSWYISVILLFGLLSPLFLYLHFLLLNVQHSFVPLVKFEANDIHEKVFFYATYGYAFSFVYTFAFHFTTASATIQIFYLLLFLSISKFAPRFLQSSSVPTTV